MTDLDQNLEELTVDTFHIALRTGELTGVELVDWYLARIHAHDHAGAGLQAVVTVNPVAHDEAAARDEFLATEGKLCGPLHGVPVLVKDQAEMAGLRTTFGSILFAGYVPDSDATLITKLRDAGAVILAKTAMCDFAAGFVQQPLRSTCHHRSDQPRRVLAARAFPGHPGPDRSDGPRYRGTARQHRRL